MDLFLHEYFFFVSSITAILVSVSSASLFFLASQYERKLRSTKRAFGFAVLALAFLMGIVERRFTGFSLATAFLETVGIILIALGVMAEPSLMHLSVLEKQRKKEGKHLGLQVRDILGAVVGILALVLVSLFFSTSGVSYFKDLPIESYLKSALQIISTVFIIVTIIYQIKRYLRERDDPKARLQNLYPLLGYIFLLIRSIGMVVYRLPELDVVSFRLLTINFSIVWKAAYMLGFVGFVFLGIWAWNFIKIRFFLRVYVVFLAIGILMASLGSLIVLLLNFRIIEINNLQILNNHAQSIDVVMEERQNNGHFIAKLISESPTLLQKAKKNDVVGLEEDTQEFLEDAQLDIIRIYDSGRKIIACPHDPRDVGRIIPADIVLDYIYAEGESVKTYDVDPGVLTNTIVSRSIYAMTNKKKVSGAVEVGYKFDTAFADFLSRETSLDITIYTGPARSATTLTTEDGVSRWVGSIETNNEVLTKVLGKGERYQGIVTGLDDEYYAAYAPIKDFDDNVIGMISASSSTYELFEDTRRQLVVSFLLVAGASLLPTLIGYFAIRSYHFDENTYTFKKKENKK